MIGIVIISHGQFAKGIMDGMRLIVGEQEKIDTVELLEGDPIDELPSRILDKVVELDSKEGVIIFVDIFGASPYIASARVAHENPEKNLIVVTGLNLPMLLEAALSRQQDIPLRELCQSLVSKGQDQIRIFPEE